MLSHHLFDYVFIESEEGCLFLAVRDHLLREVKVIRIEKRGILEHLSNDLALDNPLLSVQSPQPARYNLVDLLIKHPLSHVNSIHGSDVVGIWKVVLLIGVLGDVHRLDILLLVGH